MSKIKNVMNAWQLHKFSSNFDEALYLTSTFRKPFIIGKDKLLIKVKAASLNPMDVDMIQGYGSTAFRDLRRLNYYINSICPGSLSISSSGTGKYTQILGRDFSGVVVDKSITDSSLFSVGDKVYGATWPFSFCGSFADFVLVDSHMVAEMPKSLSFVQAASIPYAALTAYTALHEIGLLPKVHAVNRNFELNDCLRVLIIGVTGGVGLFGLQLAKAAGHHVSVVYKSRGENDEFINNLLLKLGANNIIESSQVDEELAVDGPYHIILDCINSKPLTPQNIKNRCLLYPTSSPCRFISKYVTVRQSLLHNIEHYGSLLGSGLSMADLLRNNTKSIYSREIKTIGGLYLWSFFRPSFDNLQYISKLIDDDLLSTVVYKTVDFKLLLNALDLFTNSNSKYGKIVIDNEM